MTKIAKATLTVEQKLEATKNQMLNQMRKDEATALMYKKLDTWKPKDSGDDAVETLTYKFDKGIGVSRSILLPLGALEELITNADFIRTYIEMKGLK